MEGLIQVLLFLENPFNYAVYLLTPRSRVEAVAIGTVAYRRDYSIHSYCNIHLSGCY
jgi:hypothetical protein